MKRTTVIAALAALAVLPLTAASLYRALHNRPAPAAATPPGPYRGSEPPAGVYAPDFTLRTYDGKTVRMAKLKGRVVLTTFVDSACREACPIILARMVRGLRRLDPATRRQVIALAITVSPKVDTPGHVRRFLRERGALGQVSYLIGTVRELRPVWKAYHVLPAVDTGNTDVHSADVRVFDRNGLWVSTQHAGVDLTPANLATDVRTALERSQR